MSSLSVKKALNEARSHFNKGQFLKSAELTNKIVSKDQKNIPALLLLARSMKNSNNYNVAVKVYEQILKLDRKILEVYLDLSEIYFNVKQYKDAGHILEGAEKLDSNNFDVNYRLGLVNKVLRRNVPASEYLIKAHNIQPNNSVVLRDLCSLIYITSNIFEAKKYYKKLYDLEKLDGTLITQKTLVPMFFKSAKELDDWRAEHEANLDELLEMDLEVKDPIFSIYQTFHNLIYQNRNNRHINEKYVKLMRKACPMLNFTSGHINNYTKPEGKIKIGFILRYDPRHVISRCFAKLFDYLLNDERFEPYIFSTSQLSENDNIWNKYKSKGLAFEMPIDVQKSQSIIASKKVDIIIHPELGINKLAYFLAYSRLAPFQCSFAGIPITSGLNTIDYFITCKELEPENFTENFTEKPLFMETNCDFPEPVTPPKEYISKEVLNLPQDKKIYMVPLKLIKFHPDFDRVIKKILENDENGVLVLFEGYKFITGFIKERLQNNLPENIYNRIIFVPEVASAIFPSYLKAADCLLDSFYYGSGSTSYIAGAIGTPIVTMKKGILKGGRMAGFYNKRMGLNSLIAENEDEFVEICNKLANDKNFYNEASKLILKNNHIITNREGAIEELLGKISSLVA